jgi:hypothetical protein
MSLSLEPAKAIYVANRNARLTREEFRERWLRHNRIGDVITDPRLRAISSVRYCLTVDPTGILAGATNEYDGVALLALRGVASIPSFHALLAQNDVAYADELRTFERPVDAVTVCTASELLLTGEETDVAVIELARRRPDLDPVDYVRDAESGREDQLRESGLVEAGLRRWVRNVVIAPAPRGFGYDAVNEYWFDSIDHVDAASSAIERFLEGSASHTERRTSPVLLTSVIHRAGRDRP